MTARKRPASPRVVMAGLATGVRVRHVTWECTETVRIAGGAGEVRWDGFSVADEVSPEGVVFPRALEIIGRTA